MCYFLLSIPTNVAAFKVAIEATVGVLSFALLLLLFTSKMNFLSLKSLMFLFLLSFLLSFSLIESLNLMFLVLLFYPRLKMLEAILRRFPPTPNLFGKRNLFGLKRPLILLSFMGSSFSCISIILKWVGSNSSIMFLRYD